MEELSNKKRTHSFLKKLPLEILVIGILFLAALFLFTFIAHEVVFEKEDLFDSRVIQFFSPYSSSPFIDIMKVFTFLGSGRFLIPAYIVLVGYFLIRRKMIYGLHIAIMAVTSSALSYYGKRIFQRARPDSPLIQTLKTYSFPSGHALSSFIFCSILIYLVWRGNMQRVWKWTLSILLFLVSITIGLSRIVLGMHYPSDVLAGFCLGFVWVILSFYLLNKIQPAHRVSNNLLENDTKMTKTR
ncbi:MAG: phosphatase PAP2 family protein [Chitinophagaceae bacterium]|nr:phosphatase PAP2 family protein [Chitinophagaceae bacterium]